MGHLLLVPSLLPRFPFKLCTVRRWLAPRCVSSRCSRSLPRSRSRTCPGRLPRCRRSARPARGSRGPIDTGSAYRTRRLRSRTSPGPKPHLRRRPPSRLLSPSLLSARPRLLSPKHNLPFLDPPPRPGRLRLRRLARRGGARWLRARAAPRGGPGSPASRSGRGAGRPRPGPVLESHERSRGSLLAVTRKRDGIEHRGAGRHCSLTRRTDSREAFLAPWHPGVAQAWWYCLALAAGDVAVHQSTGYQTSIVWLSGPRRAIRRTGTKLAPRY